MKKWVLVVLLALGLTACGGKNRELEQGLALRGRVLQAAGCGFSAKITADYGDKVYGFSMDCQGDGEGNLSFTVTSPETIAGITGTLGGQGGALTFGDTALAFPMLAEGLVSPVSGPITSAGREGEKLRLSLDDSYGDLPLHLDLWCDQAGTPILAEIWQDGRTLLTISLENFTLLSQTGETGHNLG